MKLSPEIPFSIFMLERGTQPGVNLFTDSEITVIRKVDGGEIQNACIRDACFRKELGPERQLTLVEYVKNGWKAKEELDRNGSSPQKKEELAFLIKRGEESRNELMATNARLVVDRAKKHQGRGMELLDLIQEGYLKFDDAVKRFESKKGYQFSTYLTWWIDQGIQRAIYTHGRTIRRPECLSSQILKIKKTKDTLRQSLDRDPTDQEVMDTANMTERTYKHVARAENETIVSLTDVENEEAGARTGFLRNKSRHCYSMDRPTEDAALANIMREQAKKLVSELPERENTVLELSFEEGLTDREIGKKLQLSTSYSTILRNKTLGLIKKKMQV